MFFLHDFVVVFFFQQQPCEIYFFCVLPYVHCRSLSLPHFSARPPTHLLRKRRRESCVVFARRGRQDGQGCHQTQSVRTSTTLSFNLSFQKKHPTCYSARVAIGLKSPLWQTCSPQSRRQNWTPKYLTAGLACAGLSVGKNPPPPRQGREELTCPKKALGQIL